MCVLEESPQRFHDLASTANKEGGKRVVAWLIVRTYFLMEGDGRAQGASSH